MPNGILDSFFYLRIKVTDHFEKIPDTRPLGQTMELFLWKTRPKSVGIIATNVMWVSCILQNIQA